MVMVLVAGYLLTEVYSYKNEALWERSICICLWNAFTFSVSLLYVRKWIDTNVQIYK